eukprot:TRINITY_DN9712_c0_g1_i1.p1 TRINITY_DN9712_c0_g1~~TRINITY_DN9712_c0_g1_i1.p1  ORF type:complete len:304 (+),score=98.37 TRINITY_DN9712_c0_g1_i1:80-913(+)
MAATPAHWRFASLSPDGAPESGAGEAATVFSFTTNELGNRAFFPSSEVSAVPTLELRHSRRAGGRRAPQVTATASLNEEHCGVGAGLTHTVRGCEFSSLWNRVFQRDAELCEKEDRGWRHEYAARAALGPRTTATAAVTRSTTDCKDKDMLDLSLSVVHQSEWATVNPVASYLSRASPAGGSQRRAGRCCSLTVRSAPLGSRRARVYAAHSYRRFHGEPAFRASEAGLCLPLAAGSMTVGAVQVSADQRELLERTSIASTSLGDQHVALRVAFEAAL